MWRNELRGPAWQPGGGVIVTPSLLADAAQLRVHRAQPGEPAKRTLASAGVGLSASLPGGFWLQLQWSQRLRSGLLAQPGAGTGCMCRCSGTGFDPQLAFLADFQDLGMVCCAMH